MTSQRNRHILQVLKLAQSAGGKTPPTKYETKQSVCEAPLITDTLKNADYTFIAITPRSTLVLSGSTW